MHDALHAAAKALALRTAKTIRQPVEHIVRRPRTQRYFLKSLRVSQPGHTDDELREAITALELVFPPEEVSEAITDPVWARRVKRLLRRFPPLKIHQLVERCRRCFGWHQELAVNVLMVAELRGVIAFEEPFWVRQKPDPDESKEVRTMVTQAGTRRKEPAVRVVAVERVLPCPLKTQEVVSVVERTSEVAAQKDILEEELREFVKDRRAKLRAAVAELETLLRQVREKIEERPVRCEERYLYEAGVVRVVRLDTRATVEERPMRPEERQLMLGAGPSVGGSKGPARSSAAP